MKIRPARRCGARRTDGRPCGAFAIVAGDVCMAHGGAARQVRAAARDRLRRDDVRRAMLHGVAAHAREVREWQIRRVAAAAAASGLDPMLLARSSATLAAVEVLAGLTPAPMPQPRTDRRFRAVRQHGLGAS